MIGDKTNVRCKDHGLQQMVEGLHHPEDTVAGCPYCLREMAAGRLRVGQGYFDSRGVAYVVYINGALRKVESLKPHQVEALQQFKEALQRAYRKERRKDGSE